MKQQELRGLLQWSRLYHGSNLVCKTTTSRFMAFCRLLCSVGSSTFIFWIIILGIFCCFFVVLFWKCNGKITNIARKTMNEEMTKSEEQHLSLQKALQQCELVQNMIDISISSLEGLRTKCATSNDLTQKEIRTLEVSTTNLCCASSSQSILRAVTVCGFFLGHDSYFPHRTVNKIALLLSGLSLHRCAKISAKAHR